MQPSAIARIRGPVGPQNSSSIKDWKCISFFNVITFSCVWIKAGAGLEIRKNKQASMASMFTTNHKRGIGLREFGNKEKGSQIKNVGTFFHGNLYPDPISNSKTRSF